LAKPSSQAFRKLGEADSNILLQSKPSDTALSSTGSWCRNPGLDPWFTYFHEGSGVLLFCSWIYIIFLDVDDYWCILDFLSVFRNVSRFGWSMMTFNWIIFWRWFWVCDIVWYLWQFLSHIMPHLATHAGCFLHFIHQMSVFRQIGAFRFEVLGLNSTQTHHR
jgi:hypothetical protein